VPRRLNVCIIDDSALQADIARALLEKVARASRQLLPFCMSHAFHVLRCEATGEAAPALAHGREAVDHAERMGSLSARGYCYLNLGLANVLNGAWHDALEALEQALETARARRLLIFEGGVLAATAAAHLGLGDHARALASAEEALAVCRRRGTRLSEFSTEAHPDPRSP
jgi:tetratricopeptide (TPR) repeat protein